MNGKRILRFYFAADSLNYAMDNLIEKAAYSSRDVYKDGNYYADKIIGIIEAKRELSLLWKYLHGVLSVFCESEMGVLAAYAMMRNGISKLPPERIREIRRVMMKFTRRIKNNIGRYGRGLDIVDSYYALIACDRI